LRDSKGIEQAETGAADIERAAIFADEQTGNGAGPKAMDRVHCGRSVMSCAVPVRTAIESLGALCLQQERSDSLGARPRKLARYCGHESDIHRFRPSSIPGCSSAKIAARSMSAGACLGLLNAFAVAQSLLASGIDVVVLQPPQKTIQRGVIGHRLQWQCGAQLVRARKQDVHRAACNLAAGRY